MSVQSRTEMKAMPKGSFMPIHNKFLQRKCTCGGSPGVDGECAECREKRLSLQRSAAHSTAPSPTVPPIVHEVLRSPGQSLDAGTRTFMESRFGHDFSQVQVHTDEQTVDSVRAINTLAYTVGKDAVFGTGQYAPITTMKKGLQFPSTSTKPDIHSSVTVIGGRDAMQTGCDVIADPRDRLSVHEGGRFRTVGEGKPKPEVLIPDLKVKTPCLFEAGMVHEQQHVQNSLKDCANFKKCVDQHSSKYLGFGEPKISFEDFGECYSKHNGGNMKDCIQNERLAYNAGIIKAKELMADSKCSKEKDTLKENITFWEKIKDHAPNCDKKTEK